MIAASDLDHYGDGGKTISLYMRRMFRVFKLLIFCVFEIKVCNIIQLFLKVCNHKFFLVGHVPLS